MELNRISLFCFGIQLGITTALGTPYRCPMCDFKTADPNRSLVHLVVVHKDWHCFQCGKSHETEELFLKHITKCHPIKKDHSPYYVCTDCNFRVFKDKGKYQEHTKKYHPESQLSSSSTGENESHSTGKNESDYCRYCSQQFGKQVMLANKWEQRVHDWHCHGTLKDFFLAVLPLHQCCKQYHGKIVDCITTKDKREGIWEKIADFSKHVYEEHKHLCLLCEKTIPSHSDKIWFQEEEFIPECVFKQARNKSFPSEETMCLCGQQLPFNVKSKLFQLRIDLLLFGSGLDIVTHPYACRTDGTKDVLSDFITKSSEEMPRPNELQPFDIDKDTGEKIPAEQNSESSPQPSTQSCDTTFASIEGKKLKKTPFDDDLTPLTDNEINIK